MAYEAITLEVKASVATGAASSVAGLKNKALQIFGTFSATLVIEASLDGTNFAVIPSGSVTAPGIVDFPFAAALIRVDTTVFASGVPNVVLSADNPKSG